MSMQMYLWCRHSYLYPKKGVWFRCVIIFTIHTFTVPKTSFLMDRLIIIVQSTLVYLDFAYLE